MNEAVSTNLGNPEIVISEENNKKTHKATNEVGKDIKASEEQGTGNENNEINEVLKSNPELKQLLKVIERRLDIFLIDYPKLGSKQKEAISQAVLISYSDIFTGNNTLGNTIINKIKNFFGLSNDAGFDIITFKKVANKLKEGETENTNLGFLDASIKEIMISPLLPLLDATKDDAQEKEALLVLSSLETIKKIYANPDTAANYLTTEALKPQTKEDIKSNIKSLNNIQSTLEEKGKAVKEFKKDHKNAFKYIIDFFKENEDLKWILELVALFIPEIGIALEFDKENAKKIDGLNTLLGNKNNKVLESIPESIKTGDNFSSKDFEGFLETNPESFGLFVSEEGFWEGLLGGVDKDGKKLDSGNKLALWNSVLNESNTFNTREGFLSTLNNHKELKRLSKLVDKKIDEQSKEAQKEAGESTEELSSDNVDFLKEYTRKQKELKIKQERQNAGNDLNDKLTTTGNSVGSGITQSSTKNSLKPKQVKHSGLEGGVTKKPVITEKANPLNVSLNEDYSSLDIPNEIKKLIPSLKEKLKALNRKRIKSVPKVKTLQELVAQGIIISNLHAKTFLDKPNAFNNQEKVINAAILDKMEKNKVYDEENILTIAVPQNNKLLLSNKNKVKTIDFTVKEGTIFITQKFVSGREKVVKLVLSNVFEHKVTSFKREQNTMGIDSINIGTKVNPLMRNLTSSIGKIRDIKSNNRKVNINPLGVDIELVTEKAEKK